MDDLDIYGDLESFDAKVELEKNTEELTELRGRYEALLNDHEHLQTEHAQLKEGMRLVKANFRTLLGTARAELDRKDNLIQELRKERDNVVFRRGQTGRGPPPPPPSTAPASVAETEKHPKETSRRAGSKDSDVQSGHGSSRRQSHDRDRDRDRDRSRYRGRDREDSSRRSRDRSRDKHRSNRSSDRPRDHKRGRRDESRDHSERSSKSRRNESPQLVQSQSKTVSSSSSSSSRSNNDQRSKKARLEAVQETHSTESPVITEVKTEAEEADKPLAAEATNQAQNQPPSPMVTEPKTEHATEPPLTSFTGSLERLKKGLLNTERDPLTVLDTNHVLPPIANTALVPASKSPTPVSEPSLNSIATSNPSTPRQTAEQSQEMAENTLQISAEIKSSPASLASTRASPSASFEIIAPSPTGRASSAVIPISECTSDNLVEHPAPIPNALHPHLTVIPAKDHLPMMVFPVEAVSLPAAHESPSPSPSPPPPPPPSAPKPKIQMLAGNRNANESKPPSNLTVAHLQARNKEQERHKLDFLREEILRVAGPEVANDPQLLSSFREKEMEEERKRLKEAAECQVAEENASSVAVTSRDADILVLDERECSTVVAPEEEEKEEARPPIIEEKNQIQPTPTTDKCIIMGNSKYNYTQDSAGNKIMVVSRLKRKKKKPSVAPQ